MIKKYKKKPVIVEFVQWSGENFEEIFEFTEGNVYIVHGNLYLDNWEYPRKVSKGNNILRLEDKRGEKNDNSFMYIIEN